MESLHLIKFYNKNDREPNPPSYCLVDENGNDIIEFKNKESLQYFAERKEFNPENIVDKVPYKVVKIVRDKYVANFSKYIEPAKKSDVFG